MKLSIDRQEKKGPFGGTYYESTIQLTLTQEEEKVARKIGLWDELLFKLNRSETDNNVLSTIGMSKIDLTLRELSNGIMAKCNGDADLHRLAFTENSIRSKCKDVKAAIDNYIASKQAISQGKYEEEL